MIRSEGFEVGTSLSVPNLPVLRCEVLGPPLTYGSKRGFYNAKTKRVILTNVGGAGLRDWQNAIRKAMLDARADYVLVTGLDLDLAADASWVPITGPAAIRVSAYLARPMNHFGKKGIRPGAPNYPTKKPDCDKIIRAIADCGSGIWYRDDRQIVDWTISKRWADRRPEGIEVAVLALTEREEAEK